MALVLAVNGRERSLENLESGATLEAAVRELALQPDRVAIEWNGEIVPRRQWGTAALQTGDKLEVVHFVGGGSGLSSRS